mmetsp:Transcript_51047/g.128082  ORF Transcript_51047/g.128082 Transcript_51047/m.128082 type:complete len:207 (+) Transcript_51047:672-1292(+)
MTSSLCLFPSIFATHARLLAQPFFNRQAGRVGRREGGGVGRDRNAGCTISISVGASGPCFCILGGTHRQAGAGVACTLFGCVWYIHACAYARAAHLTSCHLSVWSFLAWISSLCVRGCCVHVRGPTDGLAPSECLNSFADRLTGEMGGWMDGSSVYLMCSEGRQTDVRPVCLSVLRELEILLRLPLLRSVWDRCRASAGAGTQTDW